MVVREPVIKKSSFTRRIFEMRRAEKKRIIQTRAYSRYKNKWFLDLFTEATGYDDLTKYEKNRLKGLRKEIEEDYNVPVNYFSVFVYKTAYDFFGWRHRTRNNAVGFFENDKGLKNFGHWLCEKSYGWRRRRSRYPEDFGERWGRKLNIVNQRLGIGNDEVFEGEVL